MDHVSIVLYGYEDEDRFFIGKDKLVQSEGSDDGDELKLILNDSRVFTEIYLKEYLPGFNARVREIESSRAHMIITEGKTDWKHLKNAMVKLKKQGRYKKVDAGFFEYEDELQMGNQTLKRICEYQALFEGEYLKIFLFDSDDENINKAYSSAKYIHHGNQVYSMILPVPEHRMDTPLVSIENYYTDDELQTEDESGRRLFLGCEFDKETGKHLDRDDVYALDVNKDTKPNQIIDNKVYKLAGPVNGKGDIFRNPDKTSVALSKNRFAEHILNEIKPYNSVSVESFGLIFDVLEQIFEEYYRSKDHKAVEISPGVYMEDHGQFKVLSLHSSLSAKGLDKLRDAHMFSTELQVSRDNKHLELRMGLNDEYRFALPIVIGEELIDFLVRKCSNPYNKIELHIYDKDSRYISSTEILRGQEATVLLVKVLEEMHSRQPAAEE